MYKINWVSKGEGKKGGEVAKFASSFPWATLTLGTPS
jgi:hypothetical protein